jgi:hypothetical protein
MIRYIPPMILTCLVLVVGLGRADDDARKDKADPPRLKRKNRDGQPDAKQPDKEKDRAKDDKDMKDKDKAKEKEDDPIVPEDGGPMGGDPEEDDTEILERVSRNMRLVEENLGNRDVGEPTVQKQRDILKDIDSLIRRSQQQEQGGGGGGADQQPQGGMDEQGGEKQGGAKQRQQRGQGQKMAGKQGPGTRQARAQRQPRQGSGRMMAGAKDQDQGQGQPRQKQGGGGNEPGGGGDGGGGKDKDGKMYKDVWGHLPESLRAEMNAYSNPRPFMPRYDDLIKKYYRTIAEQGRKKGD